MIIPAEVVASIQTARSSDELRTFARKFLDDLGFTRSVFNFGRQYSKQHYDSVVSLFADYPSEWRGRYDAQGYANLDPVVMKSLNAVAPFTWRSLQQTELPIAAAKIFDEARDFRLYDGVTVPVRSDGNLFSMLTAVPDGTEREQSHIIACNSGTLMILTALLHERATELFTIAGNFTGTSVNLSAREREVLKWIASGKTSQDISDILKVSLATVDRHVERTMEKFGATTRSHAAVRAVMAGLVDPI